MKNKVDKTLLILAFIFLLGGSFIFLYPYISNYLAKKNHVEVIRTYDEIVANIDEETLQREKEKAQIYNENLSGDPVHDPFVEGTGYALPENYKEVLNISNDGIIGYIEIPKLSINLPIYHGTSSDVLEKGVGHVQTTSLPIGGNSTHSVLTGHTGLPNAELFTRIDELNVGDIFYVSVLNDVLTYKIYETKVILPDEIDELQITKGQDLVTLVTCTPYGVNSHRLLVKAQRTEYEEYKLNDPYFTEEFADKFSKNNNYYLIGIVIAVGILIIILISISILILLRKRKN